MPKAGAKERRRGWWSCCLTGCCVCVCATNNRYVCDRMMGGECAHSLQHESANVCVCMGGCASVCVCKFSNYSCVNKSRPFKKHQ